VVTDFTYNNTGLSKKIVTKMATRKLMIISSEYVRDCCMYLSHIEAPV